MNIMQSIVQCYATCGAVLGGGSQEQLRAQIQAQLPTASRAVAAEALAATHRPVPVPVPVPGAVATWLAPPGLEKGPIHRRVPPYADRP